MCFNNVFRKLINPYKLYMYLHVHSDKQWCNYYITCSIIFFRMSDEINIDNSNIHTKNAEVNMPFASILYFLIFFCIYGLTSCRFFSGVNDKCLKI